MTLSLGFICLATHLTRLWIKERRTSCLKIGGESSGANCPGGELSGYHLSVVEAVGQKVLKRVKDYVFSSS